MDKADIAAGLGPILDAIFKSIWHYWLESHGPGGE